MRAVLVRMSVGNVELATKTSNHLLLLFNLPFKLLNTVQSLPFDVLMSINSSFHVYQWQARIEQLSQPWMQPHTWTMCTWMTMPPSPPSQHSRIHVQATHLVEQKLTGTWVYGHISPSTHLVLFWLSSSIDSLGIDCKIVLVCVQCGSSIALPATVAWTSCVSSGVLLLCEKMAHTFFPYS